METPNSGEVKALEDIRPEHGAVVPASPAGPPQSLGPTGHGVQPEINDFWSERAKTDAIVRSMRPAALPDNDQGLPNLHEFIGPERTMNSPGSEPGMNLGIQMVMRGIADENLKLRQELRAMKEAMMNHGVQGGYGPVHQYHQRVPLDLPSGNGGGNPGGLVEMVGSAVGGLKGLLGIQDQASSSSTLIPMFNQPGGLNLSLGLADSNVLPLEVQSPAGAPLPSGLGSIDEKAGIGTLSSPGVPSGTTNVATLMGVASNTGVGNGDQGFVRPETLGGVSVPHVPGGSVGPGHQGNQMVIGGQVIGGGQTQPVVTQCVSGQRYGGLELQGQGIPGSDPVQQHPGGGHPSGGSLQPGAGGPPGGQAAVHREVVDILGEGIRAIPINLGAVQGEMAVSILAVLVIKEDLVDQEDQMILVVMVVVGMCR